MNRSSAPAFSKAFSFDLPQPEISGLAEDVDFIFLPGLQQDIFKLEIIFRAGKWWETKSGVSHFTAVMLDKGTAHKSAQQIAEIFDYYGAQFEVSPGYDFVSVSLYGLKKHFDNIFPLFREIVEEPSFLQDELELQKEIFIQNLKINNEKNSFVASKLLRKNIFGYEHPYGNSVEETDATAITSEDISDYFKQIFSPHKFFLIGNFERSKIQSLAEKFSFRKINPTQGYLQLPSVPGTDVVVKEASVQCSLRLGKRIINRDHSDFFDLLLLNHILGGYFGSRLMKNIREEKGLTYGIYSSINPFKNDCMFSIGADVGKEKKDLALLEIKNELSRLIHELIAPEELTTAKNHFLGSLQLEIANPFACLDKIKSIQLNKLDSDYYKRLFSAISKSNSSTLQGIAAKYFNPSDLHVVSVG